MTQPLGTAEYAANLALGHCGQDEMAAYNERGENARYVRQFFPAVRDELLRRKWWNFATARTTPALDPVAATGPMTKRYALPADCLRVRFINDNDTENWAVESGSAEVGGVEVETMVLVTNVTAPIVTYTRRVENPRLWDALFLIVFGYKLAAALASKCGKSASDEASFEATAERKLGEAATVDSRERQKETTRTEPSFLAARRRRLGYDYR